MRLNLGSNIIKDTSGVLIVEGKPQIKLEVGENGQALLTMDIYAQGGEHIAKLRKNAWAFNEQDQYDITTAPASLRLWDKVTDATVVEARVVSRTEVEVPRGRFYTRNSHLIEIEPDKLVMMGVTIAGNRISASGGALTIDAHGLGIG